MNSFRLKKSYFLGCFLLTFFMKVGDAGFRLSSPDVVKASWNARTFLAEDINQDGLNDLIFFNLDRSRIEILYRTKDGKVPERVKPVQGNRWDPELEDAPYKKEFIFIPETITSLAVGDLNLDGFTDIVTGSPDHGVQVYFRSNDLLWTKPIELETLKLRPDSISIKIKKEKKGNRSSLFLFTQTGLEVLGFENGKPQYPSVVYREEAKRAYGMNFFDVNRDGVDDWVYSIPSSDRSVRLRLGLKNGFGPERSFDLPVSSFNPAPNFKKNQQFVGINRISKEASVFSFDFKKNESNDDNFNILDYDLFPEGEEDTSWTIADFNGDGKEDIVAVSSSVSELNFLPAISGGDFGTVRKSSALKGVSCLHAFNSSIDKNPGLLVLSQAEKIVGISEFLKKGSFSFPKPFPIKADPILSNCSDLNGDKVDEALIIVEDRSDFVLQVWAVRNGVDFNLTQEIELDEWTREPSGIVPCYLNNDNAIDLVLLSARESAYLLLNDGNGKLKVVGEDSVFRKSFLMEKNPSQVGWGDINKDGSLELLVAGTGMIRALKWKNKDLFVTEQFNATDPKAELTCPLFLDLNGDQQNELLYFSNDYWEGLQQSTNGEYQKIYKIEDDSLTPLQVGIKKSKGSNSLLSLGSSSIQMITRSVGDKSLQINIQSRYLTDLPKVFHTGVDWGDFDNDGLPDLVCMDGRRHTLEFLKYSDQKKWESVLHFKVFEEDLHYRGKKGGALEPRDGIIADLNGDGLDDLVVLVHDRFLCYYQEALLGK